MTATSAGKKVLVVFGATAQQGGSLIRYVLDDPSLSALYHIRVVTRNPSQLSASKLKTDGVEVFQADADDPASLRRVMRGANITFAMTLPVFSAKDARDREITQGIAIADAAVVEGLGSIFFSTLPHVSKISSGKYQKVDHFDAKAEVENYMRGLPIRSIFYCPGWFMQNFNQHMLPGKWLTGGWLLLTLSPQRPNCL
jgi:uncharacterized protein YbjT (DUF2867 family)